MPRKEVSQSETCRHAGKVRQGSRGFFAKRCARTTIALGMSPLTLVKSRSAHFQGGASMGRAPHALGQRQASAFQKCRCELAHDVSFKVAFDLNAILARCVVIVCQIDSV